MHRTAILPPRLWGLALAALSLPGAAQPPGTPHPASTQGADMRQPAIATVPLAPLDATGSTTLHDGEREVRIHSRQPDSVVGDYRIDFALLDANGDGAIDRTEAAANATLSAEFAAVDADRDGRLTPAELSGWMD